MLHHDQGMAHIAISIHAIFWRDAPNTAQKKCRLFHSRKSNNRVRLFYKPYPLRDARRWEDGESCDWNIFWRTYLLYPQNEEYACKIYLFTSNLLLLKLEDNQPLHWTQSFLFKIRGGPDRTRTGTVLLPTDFKSVVSTYSTTGPCVKTLESL